MVRLYLWNMGDQTIREIFNLGLICNAQSNLSKRLPRCQVKGDPMNPKLCKSEASKKYQNESIFSPVISPQFFH